MSTVVAYKEMPSFLVTSSALNAPRIIYRGRVDTLKALAGLTPHKHQ